MVVEDANKERISWGNIHSGRFTLRRKKIDRCLI